MKGKRYSTEQKIRILREAENSDKTIQGVCRERQISEQTFHRWKRENARLKRMLADEMLGKELLKEALEKKVMSPGHKRQIVEALVIGGRCTGRAACRHFGLHRSTFAYKAKEPNAWLAKLKAAEQSV